MDEKSQIRNYALVKFAFLERELNMSKPIIKNRPWNTDIYYLASNIGLQIELDWRDLDVFILVVRLDNGSIPGGYYVLNGKTVRVHIEKILKEKWGFSNDSFRKIVGKKGDHNNYSKEAMEKKLSEYCSLLGQHAKKIINDDVFAVKL